MCGIWITPTKELCRKTYELNKERGDYSTGIFAIAPYGSFIYKDKAPDWESIDEYSEVYCGHTRAPTCCHNEHSLQDTTHPFMYHEWVVAHNGIIKNVNELKEKYNIYKDILVDTEIIPILLEHHKDIVKTLEDLDGIFGLWIYNIITAKLYIARCASSLYYQEENNIVSSAKLENSISLKEGVLYEYSKFEPIKEISTFKYKSPYFTL